MSVKDTIDDWDKWVAGVVAGLVALAYAARQLFRGLTLMVEVHDLVAGKPATDTEPAVPGIVAQVEDLRFEVAALKDNAGAADHQLAELKGRFDRLELLLSDFLKAQEIPLEDRP